LELSSGIGCTNPAQALIFQMALSADSPIAKNVKRAKKRKDNFSGLLDRLLADWIDR